MRVYVGVVLLGILSVLAGATNADAAVSPGFLPSQKLGPKSVLPGRPQLAMTPQGRAAVAWVTGGDVVVAQRPAGGSFGAPVRLQHSDDNSNTIFEAVAVALNDQ